MYDDLRRLIEDVDKAGMLHRVDGAHWDQEIGTINEIVVETKGKALLFDHIQDYPPGYRICTNLVQTRIGQRLAFGISEEQSNLEVIRDFKDKLARYEPLPPRYVETGPVMENVLKGDEVDVFQFPAPRWHDTDGGRYIGTAPLVITRDPEEGWVNAGCYRQMIHDEKTLSFYISPGKHGHMHRQKYWSKGEQAPVVIAFGCEGMLFGLSGMPLSWGMGELEVAGFLRGKPVDVIKGPITGLPIPATAEIAMEGFAPPPEEDTREEGPFAEWTGYTTGSGPAPVFNVKAVYHRNDPINYGQPPTRPVTSYIFPIPLHTAPTLWASLEKAGLSGIKGVYVHGPSNRSITVVSIKQQKPGHAKQVAVCAAGLLTGGGLTGRFTIVVDDDIDPSDLDEVIWAVSSRSDPETAMEFISGFTVSGLETTLPPHKRAARDFTTTKLIIDACRPWHWKDRFPKVVESSKELKRKVMMKWPEAFSHLNVEQYLNK